MKCFPCDMRIDLYKLFAFDIPYPFIEQIMVWQKLLIKIYISILISRSRSLPLANHRTFFKHEITKMKMEW